ncbi:hypothetical protein AGMMS49579_10880 [Spirochaetia bacterium]|nr:hypothetical protein AGMMS49579_10880 [Spirochaetia bacterium]
MRKITLAIAVCYLLFGISGSLFGVGEKTFSIGGSAAWRLVENRSGIIEMNAVRPHPVLGLASGRNASPQELGATASDLVLSFDEGRPDLFADRTGHYRVIGTAGLAAADLRWARAGNGAAFFSAAAAPIGAGAVGVLTSAGTGSVGGPSGPLVLAPRDGEALFAQGRHIRDFSMEFWLYPLNMENGEQILSWISYRPATGATGRDYIFQRIQCAAFKNRLQWNFQDFFSAPGGEKNMSLTLNGSSPVVPKTWSHHLIRFDSDTGLLEYLVNGKTETIAYASSSGREGGEVYTPIIGEGGNFVLGSRFSGLMDEFKIQGRNEPGEPGIQKYAPKGGRMETRPIDLGEGSNDVLKLEAFGGRITLTGALVGGAVRNEYAGQGDFRFSDNAAIQFFIRAANNPYTWTDADWRPVMPGTDLPNSLKGRYVQIAADFYPSGDGETSPYLEEVRILYRPDEPPLPPARIMAIAGDGAVELSWGNSPSADTAGYQVYYGLAREEYLGDNAILGVSPIDAGKRTSLRIDGLENGTVYYFAIAAYTRSPTDLNVGEFSREVSARPLRMAE